jgi:hypothetical protein
MWKSLAPYGLAVALTGCMATGPRGEPSSTARPTAASAAAAPAVPPAAVGWHFVGRPRLVLDASGTPEALHFRFNRTLPRNSFNSAVAAHGTVGTLTLHGVHGEGRRGDRCYHAPITTGGPGEARTGTTLVVRLSIHDVAGVVRARALVVSQSRWHRPRACA